MQITVTSCKGCPFLYISGDHEYFFCDHPCFVEDLRELEEDEYEADTPPTDCPLRTESVTISL